MHGAVVVAVAVAVAARDTPAASAWWWGGGTGACQAQTRCGPGGTACGWLTPTLRRSGVPKDVTHGRSPYLRGMLWQTLCP